VKTLCPGVNAKTADQLRTFNMSKSKSAGDLIAELKAHSGIASLRKVRPRSSAGAVNSLTAKNVDEEPEKREFRLVTLRHVDTALP